MIQLPLPFPEPAVALKNSSTDEFVALLEASVAAMAEYERDVAAQRARAGELLDMRFTI